MKTAGHDRAFPSSNDQVKGLTKREYFAAQALVGCVASWKDETAAAKYAVEFADALIKELNKNEI